MTWANGIWGAALGRRHQPEVDFVVFTFEGAEKMTHMCNLFS